MVYIDIAHYNMLHRHSFSSMISVCYMCVSKLWAQNLLNNTDTQSTLTLVMEHILEKFAVSVARIKLSIQVEVLVKQTHSSYSNLFNQTGMHTAQTGDEQWFCSLHKFRINSWYEMWLIIIVTEGEGARFVYSHM